LESDCNRVSSKFAEENTETWLPVVGVSVIPTTGKVKLRMVVFAGGVSEMVRLSKELPLTVQFVMQVVFSPLQEFSVRKAARAANRRDFFEFIDTPHDRIRQTALDGPDGWESPRDTLAPG
jgi:hypothetical protein